MQDIKDIKATFIQTELFWKDPDKNLKMFSQKLARIKKPTDLIILPEMFNTGFSMDVEKLSENMEGRSMQWMAASAVDKNRVVVASLIIKERGAFYNRLVWMRPDGTYACYDKRHLFRMEGENEHFKAGQKRLITELKGWKFCPLICYDLRFPGWSRNRGDCDCLIYIADWPEVRSYAWKALLTARAIENQAYVIGVNRIGKDGHGISFSGDSVIIDPRGRKQSRTKAHQESIETIDLSYNNLLGFRKKFQVHLDADDFNITGIEKK